MKAIILLLVAVPAIAQAQDTVWVETTFQKDERQFYEQRLRKYEADADVLHECAVTIRSTKTRLRSSTSFSEILRGRKDNIVISKATKASYLTLLHKMYDSISALYDKDQAVLTFLESNLHKGKYYIMKDSLNAIYLRTPPEVISRLKLEKLCSVDGVYYTWQDWLMLRLSQQKEK